MNRIHKKSTLAQTAPLILAAHDRGESLLWGRYEEQLPLCAFTSNGLNCRKCFQGPCRINPFGDQPTQGVCGADRDQIVMENFFQTTLEGVLETARSISSMDKSLGGQEIFDLNSDLPQETRKRLGGHGILPVRKAQLLEVQNSYFSHKGFLSQTLRDLTRLGLIYYGLLKGLEKSLSSLGMDRFPYDSEGANLLIVGQPFFGHLSALQKKVQDRTGGKKVNLWLQGTRGVPVFPSFPDHGSPEIALTMGLDALIIYPNAYFPSLEGLARKWEIPVLLPEKARTIESFVEEAIDMVLEHRKKNASLPASRAPFPAALPRVSIFDRVKEVQAVLSAGRLRGILLIWSEANVKQAFFERTLTLMETALNQELLVLVGGEAVAQASLLNEELARRMGRKTDDISGTGIGSINYLTCWAEIPKLIALLRALNSEKEFSQMPVVVAFPEFSRTSAWAAAVSFLSLGFAVQLGTQLPFWGSPSLSEVLLKDWPAVSGGILLTSPSLPDGKTQAREMVLHIQSRSFEK
jgi:hypothetical protein